MKTREEKIAAGCNPYDLDRVDRVQKVYDFAERVIDEAFPDAPKYLRASMTRSLLIETVEGRR